MCVCICKHVLFSCLLLRKNNVFDGTCASIRECVCVCVCAQDSAGENIM